MDDNAVTVLRAGSTINVPEDALREGDLLLLQSGDLVAADVRLVEARALEVDEWELTGEIMPAAKSVGEEPVYIYRGSTVTRGNGMGVVVATGADTEHGKSLKLSEALRAGKPPVLLRARYFALPVLLLPPLAVSWSHYNHHGPICSLAAALAITLVLLQNDGLFRHIVDSRGARRIEGQNIRIRNTVSLDVIPHVDLVCLDKSGVLTTRELSVSQIHYASVPPVTTPHGVPDQETAHLTGLACALCNDVFVVERLGQANPIDKALMAAASSNGIDIRDTALKYRRVFDKPFESKDRYMVAGFAVDDQRLYFVKGDPEVVRQMCRTYVTQSGIVTRVDIAFLQFLRDTIEAIDRDGDRAIGLAYSRSTGDAPPTDYTFLCLIQLANPLTPGVTDVVAKLRQARIRTVMLTGDRPEIATVVAGKVGIGPNPDYCLTGRELERMALSEVARQSAYVSVFARLLPSQKAVLIRLFQRTHRRVVMVGDGANDAMALGAADVAITFVQRSSPMARRVADILVSDVSDLLTVFREATAITLQAGRVVVLRDATMTATLLAWYAWNLRSLLFVVAGVAGTR